MKKGGLMSRMSPYMKLPYTIELIQEEVGGFHVKVKELPGCMSYGKTAAEAIKNIKDAQLLWIETAIEKGIDIPSPDVTGEYSGKVLLRMPKYIHERLSGMAEEEGTSLNQLIVSLLSGKSAIKEMAKELQKYEKSNQHLHVWKIYPNSLIPKFEENEHATA
ncbi:MAG: type II toxin-antitoxin system HicB family antitoxin [Candidatus Firestonebacteria bacterium]